MRNNIDKETYDWLFKIIGFFAILLTIVTLLLSIDLKGFSPKTLNFSSSLLFLIVAVGLWIRIEYLKLYNIQSYRNKRIPLWLTASIAFIVGIFRLF